MKFFPENKPKNQKLLWLFPAIGMSAIVAGGLVSAFLAHNASYLTAWAVAYTVLVLGSTQIGIGLGIKHLSVRAVSTILMISTSMLYNVGGLLVIGGTLIKSSSSNGVYLVETGGLLIALAMILCLRAVHGAKVSGLLLAYYLLVLVLFISVFIGMLLTNR